MRYIKYVFIFLLVFTLSSCNPSRPDNQVTAVNFIEGNIFNHHVDDDFTLYELEIVYEDESTEIITLTSDMIEDYEIDLFTERGVKDFIVSYEDHEIILKARVYEYDLDLQLLDIFEMALETEIDMTYEEWLESIRGEDGEDGAQGIQGLPGVKGDKGETGAPGTPGVDGEDGLGIESVVLDEFGHLIITYTDSTVVDAGQVVPVIEEEVFYTITYETYGKYVLSNEMHMEGDTITEPVFPQISNMSFGGWFTDPELTQEFEFTTMPAEDVTLYLGYYYLAYTVSSNINPYVEITNYTGNLSHFDIPSMIDGYGVKVIGNDAFKEATLKSVHIPDPVHTIRYQAFSYCPNLMTVTMDDSVALLGEGAFRNNILLSSITLSNNLVVFPKNTFINNISLTSVTYPPLLSTVEDNAFRNTGLTELVFPESVDFIGPNAYRNTQATTLEFLGLSVLDIGYQAFSDNLLLETISLPVFTPDYLYGRFDNLPMLESFTVAEGNIFAQDIDGVLFNALATTMWYYPANKAGTSYTVPVTVTSIGPSTFGNNKNLETLDFPNSMSGTSDYLFNDMESITAFNVYDNSGGYWSSVDGVLFDATGNFLKRYPSARTDTTYVVPPSVQVLYYGAFRDNQYLETITVNEGAQQIFTEAFSYMDSLTSVNLPGSLNTVHNGAFQDNTTLTSIDLSQTSNLSIGQWSFEGMTNLSSVTFGTGLLNLESMSFANNLNITSITFPAGLTNIDPNAFDGCANLEEYNISGGVIYESQDGVLYRMALSRLVLYPEGKQDNVFSIPGSVDTIQSLAFTDNQYLEIINIPAYLTRIESSGIYSLPNLQEIRIPITDGIIFDPNALYDLPEVQIFVVYHEMNEIIEAINDEYKYRVYPLEAPVV